MKLTYISQKTGDSQVLSCFYQVSPNEIPQKKDQPTDRPDGPGRIRPKKGDPGVRGWALKHRPNKNGRYLQVRFLKWPLNVCFDFFVRNSWITINLDKPSWRNPRFEIHKGCYWICSNISCQLGGKWTLFFSSCSLCTRKNGSSLSAHACGWNSWNILSILFKVPCCCPLRAFFYCPHSICLD